MRSEVTVSLQAGTTASLVDVIPGIERWLDDEQRRMVSRFQLPLLNAFDGPLDLAGTLRHVDAFAVVIVEGMVVRTLRVADHGGLQLLGPGDLLTRPGENGSDLLQRAGLQASGLVRYAALDDHVLALIQRFPRLHEGLQTRDDDQQQRLLAQLLICQLPRVEDRVLALMWLLAETWGRVTPTGTALPVTLTHDTIGLLIGAKRPTVTLALRALERRGALVRRTDDWLILERSEDQAVSPVQWSGGLPHLAARPSGSPWEDQVVTPELESPLQAMRTLRARQAATIERSRTIVATAGATAQRSHRLVEWAALRRLRRDGLHHEDDAVDLPVALRGSER